METIVKKTRELGTSAGVILPRSWLNKQVVVTLFQPSIARISSEVMELISNKKLNEEVKGIYLVGSYARGEEDIESDIDILILTKSAKGIIKHENYEIVILPEGSFAKGIKENLNYLAYVNEAKAIINGDLIEKYRGVNWINFKKILSEIRGVLDINEDAVLTYEASGKNIPDGIIYSLVLRLRELYLIKCLTSKKKYSKEEFVRIAGGGAYNAYLRVKRERKEKEEIDAEEAKKIIENCRRWLRELKE